MLRPFFPSEPPPRHAQRRPRADGRVRLTFLILGVVGAVGLFLLWDRGQTLTSFPQFEPGRYVGAISDPQAAGSLSALPLVVDVPAKGDALLLVLDVNAEGGVTFTKLSQALGRSEAVVITIAGGERIKLMGTREGTNYRGIGVRTSGGDLQWTLRPAQNTRENTPPELGDFLNERAKLALLDRRIESARAGVAKASDESNQLKQPVTGNNQAPGRAANERASAIVGLPPLDDERARFESRRAELAQNISLLETVAPGARVARSAYRTLGEQKRWLNSILLTAPPPSINAEDAEAVERGIEVEKLQSAIVAAQRRIDAVLRASDDILGE